MGAVGASRHLVRASCEWCARAPDHRPHAFGPWVTLPGGRAGSYLLPTPTRDRTGTHNLGRRSRIWSRTLPRGGSREGSRTRITSRVTGSSAFGPGRPSGRQDSSLWRDPSRDDRPPVSGGDQRFREDGRASARSRPPPGATSSPSEAADRRPRPSRSLRALAAPSTADGLDLGRSLRQAQDLAASSVACCVQRGPIGRRTGCAVPEARQTLRTGRGGVGCARRPTPRASRSARITLAAATRSGSRVTVPATQSMYDGSKAAISPRL